MKSFEQGEPRLRHIRLPNPSILISIPHVTCHHVSHPCLALLPCLTVFHLLTPFQRPLFISEHGHTQGPSLSLQLVFTSAHTSIPPNFDASPQRPASESFPVLSISLRSRDAPASAPTKAPLLCALSPPQRRFLTPVRHPHRFF